MKNVVKLAPIAFLLGSVGCFNWELIYSLYPLSQLDSTLQLSSLEFGWLKELLEKEPDAIRHEKVDRSIVLTAAPKELQKFLLKHLKTEGAFDEGGKFRRNKRAQE